jgi:hypothetical protein
MEIRLAKIISVVFHPILMPVYIMGMLLNLNAYFALVLTAKAKIMLLGMVFLSTCIFPLALIFLFIHSGKMLSLQMEKRQERTITLLAISVFYYLTWWMMGRMQLSPVFSVFIIGVFYTSVVALTINLFMKISLHMIAAGGATGLFICLSLLLLQPLQSVVVGMIFLSGIIGFARLKLNSHNPAQVYLGWIVGMTVMLSVFYFL